MIGDRHWESGGGRFIALCEGCLSIDSEGVREGQVSTLLA